MKKKNLKYVLIPAFAATTLFPVLTNDNQAHASENSDTVSAPVNNTAGNNETSTTETPTSNTATNSSSTTDVTPNVASNKKIHLLNLQSHLLQQNINKKVLLNLLN